MASTNTTTVIFSPCHHAEVYPESVLGIYRRNRVSIWCPLCQEMRAWTEGRKHRGRRHRGSARGRAAYGRTRTGPHPEG